MYKLLTLHPTDSIPCDYSFSDSSDIDTYAHIDEALDLTNNQDILSYISTEDLEGRIHNQDSLHSVIKVEYLNGSITYFSVLEVG